MNTTTKNCSGKHAGRCTTTDLYTKDDAVSELTSADWIWEQSSAEWISPKRGLRGRLAWTPDYCNPTNPNVGTEWFLTLPHRGGFLHIIGTRHMSVGDVQE